MSTLTRVVGVLIAGAALLVPAASGAGSNLLSNGTFDSSTSGWFTQNATLTRASDGLGGSAAALITADSSASSYSIAAAASSQSTAGVHYLANAFARSSSSGDVLCLLVEEWTSSGNFVGSNDSCISSTKSWQAFPQVDYVAATTGHVLAVRLLGNKPSAGDSFEADNVTLTTQQQTATAPANTSPPTISGSPQQGQTLTANPGTWTGTTPITFAYQWQTSSDGKTWTNASSGTGQTYVPTSADVGRVLRVGVLATNSAGSSGAVSAATTPVQPASSPTPHATSICGTASSPPQHYDHVIWIWMENRGFDQIVGAPGSSVAQRSPFVNGTLVTQCGLATNYHNITHPSLPNYIAATSGSTQGLTSDKLQHYSVPSLFQQVEQSGRQWRSYQESMPQNCYPTDSGLYPADHNPALAYDPLANSCPVWDVPLGDTATGALARDLANGTLPAFAFVVPNSCDSTETCAIGDGDAWLASWVPLIVNSSVYRAGKTAVFIAWDEGNKGSAGEDCLANTKDTSCHVALLALSPYTRPGAQPATFFSHYSLLRTTEELLGLPLLGHASDKSTQSMRAAFGL